MNDRIDDLVWEKDGEPFVRVRFYSPTTVRITMAQNGQFGQARFVSDLLLADQDDTGLFAIDTSAANPGEPMAATEAVRVKFEGDGLTFENKAGDRFFGQDFSPCPGETGPVLSITTNEDEGFYGFGEWFNGYRRNQGSLALYNHEAPSFTQHKRTYSAFPCFLSDRGYLVFVFNAHRGRADINKRANRLDLAFHGGWLDYMVVYGPLFQDIVEEYTRLTGRPQMLPMWSFGLWNTAYPVENQEQTLARITSHRNKGIPLDAIILDYHWEAGFHNFKWRKSLFPEPDDMIDQMEDEGVKLGLIYTPFMNRKAVTPYKYLVRLYVRNAPKGVSMFSGDHADSLYQEALEKEYFAHPDVTWWLGRGGILDFTNPEAVDWWFDMQKPLLRQGVCFFKNDGGEYLPDHSTSALGLEPGEHHNIYGFYYAKAVNEKLQAFRGDERVVNFARTTWIGTQRYGAVFLGDQTPEFKHIESTMRCALNMSLAGFSWYGADVFGLYRKPKPELHQRYAQWTLFNPIARYFSAPGAPERDPWGVDGESEENFRRHIELRMRLLPYYYSLAREAHDHGHPILRPLVYEFQEDLEVRDIWNQVMIGDALMLAPVLSPGERKRDVYFPPGQWYSWWDDKVYTGPGRQTVDVEALRAPLFVRGGRPVPLGPFLPFIHEDHRFGDLELHLYPPFNGESMLYEDDGRSLGYRDSEYSRQSFRFSQNEAEAKTVATVEPVQGEFAGQVRRRDLTLVFHDSGYVRSVTIDGQESNDAWTYDQGRRILTIRTKQDVRTLMLVEILGESGAD
jgi:alpha-glucosidase (family GH31 glycosyl hydrolase)